MNPIHKQLRIEHREQRLFRKLETLKEQRDRYLATHGPVDIVDLAIAEQRLRIENHLSALRR